MAGGGRNPFRPEAVSPAARLRLHERLRALDVDLAIVDVGAGLGYDAVDLLELGDQRIVVATAQPASVHEAFALLKAVVEPDRAPPPAAHRPDRPARAGRAHTARASA